MTSATFGPGLLPELREILLSVGQGISYGPDGEPTAVTDEPFLDSGSCAAWDTTPNEAEAALSAS